MLLRAAGDHHHGHDDYDYNRRTLEPHTASRYCRRGHFHSLALRLPIIPFYQDLGHNFRI